MNPQEFDLVRLRFLGCFAGPAPVRGEAVVALDLAPAATRTMRGRAAAERYPPQQQVAKRASGAGVGAAAGGARCWR